MTILSSKRQERIAFLVRTYGDLYKTSKQVYVQIIDPIQEEKKAIMEEIKRIRDITDEEFDSENETDAATN